MKIDRSISIIMLLLEQKKISAAKLAEMFEVTPRTIYRDMEAINAAGIPVISYPGMNGGFGIMEQYKIEKKLFTVSDITALLIGLRSIPTTISSEEVLNAIVKIKGLVPEEQIRDIELKSGQIAVDHTPWLRHNNLEPNLKKIKTALNENKLISFEYSDQNNTQSERKVEPYRLVLKNSKWYLQAYCTTRSDFRTFKLSRILSLQILEETFAPRKFDYFPLDITNDVEKKSIPIKLLVDESLRDMMEEFCGRESIEPCGNNKLFVRFPFVEDEFWYGMILRLGDRCECLEPENVREEIIKRVERMLNVYKNKVRTVNTNQSNNI